jgi:hypothetical protein
LRRLRHRSNAGLRIPVPGHPAGLTAWLQTWRENSSSADTPLIGSSSNSSFGALVSAIAMSSNLRSPPGNSATFCLSLSDKRCRAD